MAVEYVLLWESEQLQTLPPEESNDTAAMIRDPAVLGDVKARDREVPLMLLVAVVDCR
jgi:hypothetical protein